MQGRSLQERIGYNQHPRRADRQSVPLPRPRSVDYALRRRALRHLFDQPAQRRQPGRFHRQGGRDDAHPRRGSAARPAGRGEVLQVGPNGRRARALRPRVRRPRRRQPLAPRPRCRSVRRQDGRIQAHLRRRRIQRLRIRLDNDRLERSLLPPQRDLVRIRYGGDHRSPGRGEVQRMLVGVFPAALRARRLLYGKEGSRKGCRADRLEAREERKVQHGRRQRSSLQTGHSRP